MHGGATETGAPLPSFQPEALDAALQLRATRLRELDDNPYHAEVITDSSARRYSRVVQDCAYDVWHLSEEGKAILERLRQSDPSLLELEIDQTRVGSDGAAVLIAAVVGNTVLRRLDLSCNELSDADIGGFAEVLGQNNTLEELSFYGMNSPDVVETSAGIVKLAQALAWNTTLTHLLLGHCFVGDEGAEALGEALRVNTTLEKLNLESSQIGAAGRRNLLAGLMANTTLTTIDLQGIGNLAADDMVEVLVTLWPRGVRVSVESALTSIIATAMAASRKLAVDDAVRRTAQAALAAPETEAGAAAAEGGAPLSGDDGADAERPAKVRRT